MTHAGRSARQEAESSRRAAEHLEKKAQFARQRAENFANGAEGEVAVAQALTPLMASGWYVLNDRVNPAGGNIDHIVVGPGAVIVLDAKAWSSHLEVRNGRLYASGWNKSRELTALDGQATAVRDALGGRVHVDQALVITTQPDFEPQPVGSAGVLGVDFLHTEIGQAPAVFSPAEVESMVTTLMNAFPPAGSAPSARSGLKVVDSIEPSDLFERSHRFLYLTQWRKHGKHRVYLKDEFGEDLGFADLLDRRIEVTYDDDVLAIAVLQHASARGVDLTQKDVPKVPVDLLGGRLLGLIGRLYTSVLIGSLWQGKGKRYLYGTFANPTEGVVDLGHVDLGTGWVKPKVEGPILKDRRSADEYLAMIRDRNPST